MNNIEYKSLKDILKESVEKCSNVDEKINKLIDLITIQTKLIDYVISELPSEIQEKILKKSGFKKGFINE